MTQLPPQKRPVETWGPALEALYARLNQPHYIMPDPLGPVLRFEDPADQEVVGLIAASLAFGNVKTILRSIERVLEAFPSPAHDLHTLGEAELRGRLQGFRHRYIGEEEMGRLLCGMRALLHEHGSLGNAFEGCWQAGDETVLPALGRFVDALMGPEGRKNYLLPHPCRGSACKRMLLYLRWMLRRDAVDPGPWREAMPHLQQRLVVPLDTHMYDCAQQLGFTLRRQANLRCALEVTAAFRQICPEDPARYDFALTRLGIHPDCSKQAFFSGAFTA